MKMQRVGWPLTHTHTRGCSMAAQPGAASPWAEGWAMHALAGVDYCLVRLDAQLSLVELLVPALDAGRRPGRRRSGGHGVVGWRRDSRREELWPSSAAVCWRRRRSNNPGSSPRVRWTWNREERYVIFTIAGIGADYAFMEHVLGGRIFGRVYVGRTVIANC